MKEKKKVKEAQELIKKRKDDNRKGRREKV